MSSCQFTENKPLQLQPVQWKNFTGHVDGYTDQLFSIEVPGYFEQISSNYQQVLSEAEMAKSKRFHQEEDRKRHIVTRHAIRKILSPFIKVDADRIVFGETANHKPAVAGIFFNISHSGDYVLIFISRHDVGVDVEYIHPVFDYAPVIPDCFDAAEQQAIDSAKNKREAFYTLWTRKEALLKATGEGLVDDLTAINCLPILHQRYSSLYHFSSWRLNHEYIFSLVRHADAAEPQFWNYTPQ